MLSHTARVGDVHFPESGPLILVDYDSIPQARTADDEFEDYQHEGYRVVDATEGAPFLFNVFDLLSGDPSAWFEALRFAPKVGAVCLLKEQMREAALRGEAAE